jgi:hypothetical protein
MRENLRRSESGIALITVMLVMLLASGLMAGMYAAVVSDQRSHGLDRDQSRAYAAAHAGLEKLTTQLAQLFSQDFSPSGAQITTASATPPSITGFNFIAPGGGPGYVVSFNADSSGNPLPSASNDITTGPFAGFKGLITPYTLTVTARSTGSTVPGSPVSEVRLRREVQTVAVPVFQFGVFGEKSLSFHAGTQFDFGGRVHTNQNLFLAHNSGQLYFRDKITVVGEVVRKVLENGALTASSYPGQVMIPQVIGSTYRNLTVNEGSWDGVPPPPAGPPNGTAAIPGWENLSKVTYQTNIRNTLTGAKRLDLPLVSQGAQPIDLIQRPDLAAPDAAVVFGQRYFAQASLRILLSDRAADISNLPTVTAGAPIALDGTWNPAGLPPVAQSMGTHTVAITGVGASTLTMAAGIPNWLRAGGLNAFPPMVFGGVTVSGCTGMTATTLTGCTTTGTTPINTNAAAPTALDASIGGGTVQMRTGAVASAPAGAGVLNRTVTVASTRGLTLGSRVVWSGNIAVTCTGYSIGANQLNGCTWSAAPVIANPLRTNYLSAAGQSLLGGFIKIERQNAAGVWTDVTAEILGLGFSAPNQEGTSAACDDPTPNAVIRIQRLRDNGTPLAACWTSAASIAGSYGTGAFATTPLATDFWPNALFDARESSFRNQATAGAGSNPTMGGVMNYITLDVGNLKRWLSGAIGASGAQALNNNGYIVYFSDRRGNHDWDQPNDPETGEYGNEDSLNMAAGGNFADQAPNTALNLGEDRNEDGDLDTYGARVENTVAGVVPAGAPGAGIYSLASTPLTTFGIAAGNIELPAGRINKQVLFRRALKVANGCIGVGGVTPGCTAGNGVNNLPDSGLTIVAENGIYVQGNYNATSASAEVEPNRPSAIIGDSIVILSNNWLDARSFNTPNDMGGRQATNTGYRFAMIAGKSVPFLKQEAWQTQTNWGSDGGVHNFLRMLEDWNGGANTVFYRGSMVSLYTARQFIGIFRDHDNVYDFPTRTFSFDVDFLDPTRLPPGTPMFRDVNTLRFRQILRPNQ